MIKFGLVIQQVRIETYADLRRQLMGIDTAFLAELTDRFMPGKEEAAQAYDFDEFMGMLETFVEAHYAHLDVGEPA